MNWFNQLRNSLNDDSKIADMLEDAKENGVMPSIKDAYQADKVLGNLNDMFNLLDISGGEKKCNIARFRLHGRIFMVILWVANEILR